MMNLYAKEEPDEEGNGDALAEKKKEPEAFVF